MPLCSAFAKTLLPPTAPAPPAANKNWNPGNYIASTSTNNDAIWDITNADPGKMGVLQRLQADTVGKWKGALLRFQWTQLEGDNLGEYDWGLVNGKYTQGMVRVQNYLDQMSAYPGRRLIIFIQLKTFSTTDHSVPLYMQTDNALYGDGTDYHTSTVQGSRSGEYCYLAGNTTGGGLIPNLHVNAVRDRLKALMQEFATRFNNNPYLEAVCFTEASILQPAGSPADWNTMAWYNNMTNVFTDMRTNLSNIQVAQWINGDRADMDVWVPKIRAQGIGLGMPDLCPEEDGFNYRNDIVGHTSDPRGNIMHCQQSNGQAIIMGHASKPALSGTVVGRCQTSGTIQGRPKVYPAYPGNAQTRQDIHDFAVNTVGVTHLLWAHNTGTQPNTGDLDPQTPPACQATEIGFTAPTDTPSGAYGGKRFNTVTDNWIHHASSTITTVTTRPTGW